MKIDATCEPLTGELSQQARERMSQPLFHADWLRVVFLHYEIEPASLQPWVPFDLDLRDGMAYVSLVAFTMRGLRSDFFAGGSAEIERRLRTGRIELEGALEKRPAVLVARVLEKILHREVAVAIQESRPPLRI